MTENDTDVQLLQHLSFLIHLRVRVMLIIEDYCDCEMKNRNNRVVPLLSFVSKCNKNVGIEYNAHDAFLE